MNPKNIRVGMSWRYGGQIPTVTGVFKNGNVEYSITDNTGPDAVVVLPLLDFYDIVVKHDNLDKSSVIKAFFNEEH